MTSGETLFGIIVFLFIVGLILAAASRIWLSENETYEIKCGLLVVAIVGGFTMFMSPAFAIILLGAFDLGTLIKISEGKNEQGELNSIKLVEEPKPPKPKSEVENIKLREIPVNSTDEELEQIYQERIEYFYRNFDGFKKGHDEYDSVSRCMLGTLKCHRLYKKAWKNNYDGTEIFDKYNIPRKQYEYYPDYMCLKYLRDHFNLSKKGVLLVYFYIDEENETLIYLRPIKDKRYPNKRLLICQDKLGKKIWYIDAYKCKAFFEFERENDWRFLDYITYPLKC